MLNLFRKHPPLPWQTRTVVIGDRYMTIDLPSHFITERDEELVTVAYDPFVKHVAMRISVLYLSVAANPQVTDLGTRQVNRLAVRDNQEPKSLGDKSLFSHIQPTL